MHKKKKRIMAGVVLFSMVIGCCPCVPAHEAKAGSAPSTATTYKELFNEMYEDVITDGTSNGYFSETNAGYPYHAAETLYIDDEVDYGHLSTAEDAAQAMNVAMLYEWLNSAVSSNQMKNAWEKLQKYTPTTQTGFMSNSPYKAYQDDWETVEAYPKDVDAVNVALSPMNAKLRAQYGQSSPLKLYARLVDVDDWYGFGGGNSTPTFINTFKRGTAESVWETIPHGAIEELKYGTNRGMLGLFTTESSVAKQYDYVSDGRAEKIAAASFCQAAESGVSYYENTDMEAEISTTTDELRNLFYDQYYKQLGCQNKSSSSVDEASKHYLFSSSTEWGGALDGSWASQISGRFVHSADQNPYVAYQMQKEGSALRQYELAADAVRDYEISLARQLEFLQWLQSSEGAIAWGATNSHNGRYETYPSDLPLFYDMEYVSYQGELDNASDNASSIDEQTDAILPVAMLYKQASADGDMGTASTCKDILDKWVAWVLNNIELNTDGTYAIPEGISWSGNPDTWTGVSTSNTELCATVATTSSTDFAAAFNIATILMYYAKTSDIATANAYATSDDIVEKALYVAHELMNRSSSYRDEKGMAVSQVVPADYYRLFDEKVWVPNSYGEGTMPNGDDIKNGINFLSIRSQYKNDSMYDALKNDYEDNGATDTLEVDYHVFSEQCDVMKAYASAAILYPDMTIDSEGNSPTPSATPASSSTPSSTPASSVSPGSSSAPGSSTVPGSSSTPGSTATPAASSTPSSTPASSASPGSSSAPGSSAVPGSSSTPGGTSAPGSSSTPSSTPASSVSPTGSATPGSSSAPGSSAVPGSSSAPGSSAAPGSSSAPGSSAAPGTSGTLGSTAAPTTFPSVSGAGAGIESGITSALEAALAAVTDVAVVQRNSAAMNQAIGLSCTGNAIKVKWAKTASADGYEVYVSEGNKKAITPSADVKDWTKNSIKIKKINGKKFSSKKQYKVQVCAYKYINGKKVTIGKSLDWYVVGAKNKKYTNVKNIKLTTKKLNIKTGKKAKIKLKTTKQNNKKKLLTVSKVKAIRYESSNTLVATVNSAGKIKGIKKGSCSIYVYALNGVKKKAKVVVK